MDNIRLNDEGLLEINPTASRDQQMEFIDAYRQIQGENTAQLGESAHALGSDLTAPYGGLHGPSEYMKSRYQTPQTESRIASLRTAAQLAALNQAMENEKNKWSNRYNQAYRNAVARSRASSSSGGAATISKGTTTSEDNVVYEPIEEGNIEQTIRSNAPGTTVIWSGETDLDTGKPGYDVYDTETGKLLTRYSGDGTKQTFSYLDELKDVVTGGSGGIPTLIKGIF